MTISILLATIGFGIGAALEKATLAAAPTATTSHASSGEAAGSIETSGESTAATSETVLGFNPESTPLIVGAILGSLALAGGVWLYWRRSVVLWVTVIAMTSFGALDLVEVVHQVALQHQTLVAMAAAAVVLHSLAALLALSLAFRGAMPALAPA